MSSKPSCYIYRNKAFHLSVNQIESVLHKILHELKVLYANHAPQLKPRSSSHHHHSTASGGGGGGGSGGGSGGGGSSKGASSSSSSSSSNEALTCDSPEGCKNSSVLLSVVPPPLLESVDPVTDMFMILEGSALVPFAEVSRWQIDWC